MVKLKKLVMVIMSVMHVYIENDDFTHYYLTILLEIFYTTDFADEHDIVMWSIARLCFHIWWLKLNQDYYLFVSTNVRFEIQYYVIFRQTVNPNMNCHVPTWFTTTIKCDFKGWLIYYMLE